MFQWPLVVLPGTQKIRPFLEKVVPENGLEAKIQLAFQWFLSLSLSLPFCLCLLRAGGEGKGGVSGFRDETQ
jgi:hypothetical protein